jgi:hypothetical protein
MPSRGRSGKRMVRKHPGFAQGGARGPRTVSRSTWNGEAAAGIGGGGAGALGMDIIALEVAGLARIIETNRVRGGDRRQLGCAADRFNGSSRSLCIVRYAPQASSRQRSPSCLAGSGAIGRAMARTMSRRQLSRAGSGLGGTDAPGIVAAG